MKYTILFILIHPVLIFSQTTWQKIDAKQFMEAILNFENSINEDESYSFNSTYLVYESYIDSVPIKSFAGKMMSKNGNEINMQQGEMLMIQNQALNITIDSLRKVIVVQFPDSTFNYRKTLSDYNMTSKIATAFYQKKIHDKVKYLIELKDNSPYHGIQYTFENEAYISEIIIYSNRSFHIDKKNTNENEKAKIVIHLSEIKKGKNANFNGFIHLENCITQNEINKKLTAVGKYANYEIIDLRNYN